MLLISLLTIITLRTLPVLNKNLNEIILPNQATNFIESRMSHIFYTRITVIILILTALVSGQFVGFLELDKGYSLYNGYFHVNQITILTEIFILLMGVLILLSWPGVPTIHISNIGQQSNLNNNNKIINLINYYQNFLDKSKDYSLIILFNIFGALLLISSFNLISLYIGIELQSFALYILATLFKESRIVTAAGLKYFILGALSTCFILLGFAFIYAFTGLTNIDSIYCLISTLDSSVENSQFNLGIVLVFMGFLFKIAAAPLHNWSPAKRFWEIAIKLTLKNKLFNFNKEVMRVKLSNFGNTLKIKIPNFIRKNFSGWTNYSDMVTSFVTCENIMGNRESKSFIFNNVKEQRVNDSYLGLIYYSKLRYTLMAYNKKHQINIPSKQLNSKNFSMKLVI